MSIRIQYSDPSVSKVGWRAPGTSSGAQPSGEDEPQFRVGTTTWDTDEMARSPRLLDRFQGDLENPNFGSYHELICSLPRLLQAPSRRDTARGEKETLTLN